MKKYHGRIRGKIKQKFGTLENFAKEYGKGTSVLSKKLNGEIEWKVSEVEKVCKLLDIPVGQIDEYFFCE